MDFSVKGYEDKSPFKQESINEDEENNDQIEGSE